MIEVLPPGTEGDDRGERCKQYRKISSLKEYRLVNTENMGVDIYRLNAAGKWELTPYFPEAENEAIPFVVGFASVDFKCSETGGGAHQLELTPAQAERLGIPY